MQLAQGFVYGIWSRFFLDIFPFSYRHIYQVAEEMAADFLCSSIKFVAYHRNVLSPVFQFLQHLHHVRIRLCVIHIVYHIMLAEIL